MFAIEGYKINALFSQKEDLITYQGTRQHNSESVFITVARSANRKQTQDRIQLTFEIARGLNHPNIGECLDLEKSTQGPALIFANEGGIPLREAIKSGSVSLENALDIAIQLAGALEYLHQNNVMHRDLNPSNVTLNPETNRVQIIDFSFSSPLTKDHQQSIHSSQLRDSLAYISPEQTGRMNRAVDNRTDLYSLGATLFELLTGQKPFEYETSLEMVHAHIAKRPRPLHEINTAIPEILSNIILKLLKKNAENRYQTAHGLKFDLLQCRLADESLHEFSFELGEKDFSSDLQIPQRLFGREKEIQICLDAFEQTRNQGRQLISVSGYSGVGKTSLVNELQKPIAAAGGYYIDGKCDPLQKDIPYYPWLHAFEGFIDQLLTEDEVSLNKWKTRIQDAVGENGKVLTEVISNLEMLLGEQPNVQELEPVQHQNRFDLAIQNFLQAISLPEHPVVIFIDDMQWADSASLKLLTTLLDETSDSSALSIVAYRDNEVNSTHPFAVCLEELAKAGVIIRDIALPNLSRESMHALISETLQVEEMVSTDLASLIFEKTYGNAFFVKAFLESLYEQKLLVFDFDQLTWMWDIAKIKQQNITNNVVELMQDRIEKISPDAREILKSAACIGVRFELEMLEIIAGKSRLELIRALQPALTEGLIDDHSVFFKFAHDRIHQLVYELILTEEKQPVHYKVGQLLLEKTPATIRPRRIFEIVNHLNRGDSQALSQDEKDELSELNFEAGKKAKQSNAYDAAENYLSKAVNLLPADPWNTTPKQAFQLIKERAEIAYLLGEFQHSEGLILDLMERATSPLSKIDLYCMLVLLYTMASKYSQAIEKGREGLALMGIDLPLENIGAAVGEEIGAAFANLGDREIASLIDAELMKDPEMVRATELLSRLQAPAFFTNGELFALIVTKIVNLSLTHGHIPPSCFGYGCFGLILSASMAQYQAGYQFGLLSLNLARKLNSPSEIGRAYFHLGQFTSFWVEPLEVTRAYNHEGYLNAIESGDLQYAGYLGIYKAVYPRFQEKSLDNVLRELDAELAFSRKTQNVLSEHTLLAFKHAFTCLSGASEDKANFDTDESTDAEYIELCNAQQSVLAICIYNIQKAKVYYIHGMHRQALLCSNHAEELIGFISGMIFTLEHFFYRALIVAACIAESDTEERIQLDEQAAVCLEKLKSFAESCPENFEHHYLTAKAEYAFINNQGDVLEDYTKAHLSARQQGYLPIQALINERLAKYWSSKGMSDYASYHIKEALFAYDAWGAKHKVRLIEEAHPHVVERKANALMPNDGDNSTLAGQRTISSSLDLNSVIKASQALSSKLVLKGLLENMMQIMMENAGAEKGYFLVPKGNEEYVIQAEAHIEEQSICVSQNGHVDLDLLWPRSIVTYASRTREPLVINDAAKHDRFKSDPYIESTGARSILCIPIQNQNELAGIIYLENDLVSGAFTDERLEVLGILASQLTISYENSVLYDEMEQRVAARTKALQQSLQDLQRAQAQLVQAEKMASLGELTAGIAHEIKNPLNFVNNFAQLNNELAKELSDLIAQEHKPQYQEILESLKINSEQIFRHGKRADDIVEGMMQHATDSRAKHFQTEINPLVAEQINKALSIFKEKQPESLVQLDKDLDPSIAMSSIAPQEIARVLQNILTNAFDAITERVASEDDNYQPYIGIKTLSSGDHVLIQISDNGAGIPASIMNQIFEPFFTTKHTGRHTGLGLSLSYDIITQGHSGILEVVSKEGEGTTFTVKLPLG